MKPTIAELLQRHPTPWSIREDAEKLVFYDANECEVRDSSYTETIDDSIVDLINWAARAKVVVDLVNEKIVATHGKIGFPIPCEPMRCLLGGMAREFHALSSDTTDARTTPGPTP